MDILTVFAHEWRTALKQRSFYTFLFLFTFTCVMIFLILHQVDGMAGYTQLSATMMNIVLYLLPLMTLFLGALSLTQEKEDRRFELVMAYPLTTASYIVGKFVGQFAAQWIIITFSFGLANMMGLFAGVAMSVREFLLLYLFTVLLAAVFLALGFAIGAFSATRWQSLMAAVAVWFLLIMVWPSLLIGVLGFLPFGVVSAALQLFTLLNPAEVLRILFTNWLGGGAIFGQPYYELMTALNSRMGHVLLALYVLIFVSFHLTVAIMKTERMRKYGL